MSQCDNCLSNKGGTAEIIRKEMKRMLNDPEYFVPGQVWYLSRYQEISGVFRIVTRNLIGDGFAAPVSGVCFFVDGERTIDLHINYINAAIDHLNLVAEFTCQRKPFRHI